MTHANNNPLSRRRFLQYSTLGLAGLSSLPLVANQAKDYKALVCIFLYGGNDSHNMLIPTGAGNAGYDSYAKVRGKLAVKDHGLTTFDNDYHYPIETRYTAGSYDINTANFNINAMMPELAALFNTQQATAVLNSGALAMPVTKDQLKSDKRSQPSFLFAHNHQQRIAQTAKPFELNTSGWAGRIADLDIQHKAIPLNLSYSGNRRLQTGERSTPLILGTHSVPKLIGMENPKWLGHRQREALYTKMLAGSGNNWDNLLSNKIERGLQELDAIRKVLNTSHIKYRDKTRLSLPLFSIPTAQQLGFETKQHFGKLIQQLEATAKMIALNARQEFESNSRNRQIFMVSLGGFDTHANQASKHPQLLRELSLALESFQLAMNELGLGKHVRAFTMTDFNRTLSVNGDGTDHAWGGHQLILGDGIKTRSIGQFADFQLGGVDDYGNKGRFIPTISQDQISASLASWFGVADRHLPQIFPQLSAFQTDETIRSSLFHSLL